VIEIKEKKKNRIGFEKGEEKGGLIAKWKMINVGR